MLTWKYFFCERQLLIFFGFALKSHESETVKVKNFNLIKYHDDEKKENQTQNNFFWMLHATLMLTFQLPSVSSAEIRETRSDKDSMSDKMSINEDI